MTPYGFLAWVATQGIKHIPKRLLIQAFNSFKGELPSNQVILKTAKNLYDDVIKKTSTQKIADKVRQKIKPIIPKQFNKFEPKIVKPKQLDKNFIRISKDQIDDIERSIANKPKTLGDALKTAKYTKVPTPKGLKPPSIKKSNVIPLFPKKPLGKADGGSVDKALPKKSRDI